MASKRRNTFYQNKKQEATEIGREQLVERSYPLVTLPDVGYWKKGHYSTRRSRGQRLLRDWERKIGRIPGDWGEFQVWSERFQIFREGLVATARSTEAMGCYGITALLIFALVLDPARSSASSARPKRQESYRGDGSVTNFLGQLTSLINSNGGLGPAIQQAVGGAGSAYGQQNYQQQQQAYQQQQEAYQQQQQYQQHQQYPPPYLRPNGFLGALASIARYDDLKCVPRLLCEVTSGSKPGGYDGKDNSLIPFASKDSLIANQSSYPPQRLKRHWFRGLLEKLWHCYRGEVVAMDVKLIITSLMALELKTAPLNLDT
ncbi:hypothetical protein AAG570_011269 [Ranatra chinensis]|uniref:Uncharacterized protein n=1 Tax=Ranatra chinensis TaxID=642074 RepID=A0ABD0YK43_9HEMI